MTRALARTLPASVDITATDLNPAMLEQAKSHAGLGRIAWREADAMELPFPDEAFEYVICQFGVMFFRDKQTGSVKPFACCVQVGNSCSTYGARRKVLPASWCKTWLANVSLAIRGAWSPRNITTLRRSALG